MGKTTKIKSMIGANTLYISRPLFSISRAYIPRLHMPEKREQYSKVIAMLEIAPKCLIVGFFALRGVGGEGGLPSHTKVTRDRIGYRVYLLELKIKFIVWYPLGCLNLK